MCSAGGSGMSDPTAVYRPSGRQRSREWAHGIAVVMHADGWQISCIPDAHVQMERLHRACGEFSMHLFVDPFCTGTKTASNHVLCQLWFLKRDKLHKKLRSSIQLHMRWCSIITFKMLEHQVFPFFMLWKFSNSQLLFLCCWSIFCWSLFFQFVSETLTKSNDHLQIDCLRQQ